MAKGVDRQVRLPLSKAVEIAAKSLRVRLVRSLLTLLTIAMAIAFLTNVWATRSFEPAVKAAAAAGGVAGEAGQTVAGGVARTVWLLTLSLLVCLVGISNAMLMSVMERFREIGTMKCLGALDSFILKLFFLESLFLGAVGTAVGAIVGMLLAFLVLARTYGLGACGAIGWGDVFFIGGTSAFIGLAVTSAAALYPAWKAARMEPIAAMRVDV